MYGVQQGEVFSFRHPKANAMDQMYAQTTACQCGEGSEQSQHSALASCTCAGKNQIPALNLPPDFTPFIGVVIFKTNLTSGDVAGGLLSIFLLIQTTSAAELITSLLKDK